MVTKMEFPTNKNIFLKLKATILCITITLITKSNGHGSSSNSSDIFIAAGHADTSSLVSADTPALVSHSPTLVSDDKGQVVSTGVPSGDNEVIRLVGDVRPNDDEYRTPEPTNAFTFPVPPITDADEVIFIKNEPEVERVGDNPKYFPREELNLNHILREAEKAKTEPTVTEAAREDVMFVEGKNYEVLEKSDAKPVDNSEKHTDTRRFNDYEMPEKKKATKKKKIDCTNLDCNNTAASVCGERIENNFPKYRLFLNQCYFRRVNCGFKYEYNRYRRVKLDKCSNVGSHSKSPPPPVEFRAFPPFNDPPSTVDQIFHYFVTTKPFFRRFMEGRQCDHPCPVTCPGDYDPECAVSMTGHQQVFANHCEMDRDSCDNGNVWQRRPLSFCVGAMKADLQENRRWIHWMQRTGIVDKRGRIVLNAPVD